MQRILRLSLVLSMLMGALSFRALPNARARTLRAPRPLRSEEPQPEPAAPEAAGSASAAPAEERKGPVMAAVSVDEDEEQLTPEQKKAQTLRDQEKFMVRETGNMECSVCGYIYKEDEGDNRRLPPGTPWDSIADNWRCPDCGAPKEAFQMSLVTIPGFEVNQGYGFGGNAMTGDQKTGLIFGGLVVFFLVFMSGYLLE